MTSIATNSCIKVHAKLILEDALVVPVRVSSFENVVPTWYNNLPVKILVNIFQYFKEEELRKCIIPVCQHWKYAAQRPILWKNLVIKGRDIPLHFICKQLRMFTQLESILLDNISEPTTVIRQICRCTPHLKFIAIRYCSSVLGTAIRFIISSCPFLEGLDLCGTDIRGNFGYTCLGDINRLKKLNLSDCKQLYIKSLISIVLNCPHLEDLRISKFSNKRESFLNEDAILILTNISEQLKSLSIDCTTLGSISIQNVFECRRLQRLGLFGATNLTGAQFMNIWKKLPNLKQLKIRNAHQIGDYHVINIFTEGRAVMKNLVYLDFSGCFKISDEAIIIIANCCNKLRHLGLKSCKSIMDLSPVIEANPQLEVLNIAFMVLLATDILPFPTALKKLFIDESRLMDDWLLAVRANNRNVLILVCHSEYNKTMSNMNGYNLVLE
ncbi:hypothetical protein Trydic_g22447 [Trypoxylus dichotomus]